MASVSKSIKEGDVTGIHYHIGKLGKRGRGRVMREEKAESSALVKRGPGSIY